MKFIKSIEERAGNSDKKIPGAEVAIAKQEHKTIKDAITARGGGNPTFKETSKLIEISDMYIKSFQEILKPIIEKQLPQKSTTEVKKQITLKHLADLFRRIKCE